MQNSLERIFDGLCATLREVILPEVSDPWTRIQVEAAVGLLANMATRVEWRCADLAGEIAAVREVLEGATGVGGAAPELAIARAVLAEAVPADGDNARLVAARSAHLEALGGVQEWVARCDAPTAQPVRAALQRLLVDQLEEQLALLAAARRFAAKTAS